MKDKSFAITQQAAAELVRQASFAGTPGYMYIDFLKDSCDEGWMHIQLLPGSNDGVPLARTDGVTLFVSPDKLSLFQGLKLNYFGDLSGGGFLISTPDGAESCACGAGFRFVTV
tara:strand:+ start:471 stop:812 length:342 start_codon:yes stop_codon:yes gene_type:complete